MIKPVRVVGYRGEHHRSLDLLGRVECDNSTARNKGKRSEKNDFQGHRARCHPHKCSARGDLMQWSLARTFEKEKKVNRENGERSTQ